MVEPNHVSSHEIAACNTACNIAGVQSHSTSTMLQATILGVETQLINVVPNIA